MSLLFRPELDSELLDDRTKVLGVLAADNDGMCLMGKYCNLPEDKFQYHILTNRHIMQLLEVYLFSITHLAKGEIDKGLVALATALSSIASSLEEDAEELPTIIIDTEET